MGLFVFGMLMSAAGCVLWFIRDRALTQNVIRPHHLLRTADWLTRTYGAFADFSIRGLTPMDARFALDPDDPGTDDDLSALDIQDHPDSRYVRMHPVYLRLRPLTAGRVMFFARKEPFAPWSVCFENGALQWARLGLPILPAYYDAQTLPKQDMDALVELYERVRDLPKTWRYVIPAERIMMRVERTPRR